MRLILFLHLLFMSFSVLALKEQDLSLLYQLLEKEEGKKEASEKRDKPQEKKFYSMRDFRGSGGFRLKYAKFGKGRGDRGAVIFVNGKGDNIFKYMELFYDLYVLGWSPIYTYDHRGQGFSDRIQSSEEESYTLFRQDFGAFLRIVRGDLEVDRSRLFAIAHSMGGAIVLDYLQTYSTRRDFEAVALSAPMIKIESNMWKVFEDSLLFALDGFCFVLPCEWRFPSLRNRWTQDTLTNSSARYAFSEYLTDKKFPSAQSDGTSFKWIIESFNITNRLMKEDRIRQISVPFLILQAEQEYFVLNEYHNLFCEESPHCCHRQKIKGKHEIFLERDTPRAKAIKHTTRFFLDSRVHFTQCSGFKAPSQEI